MRRSIHFFQAALLTAFTALALSAKAQTIHTADRQDSISAFAAATRVYTDFNTEDMGFTFGGDFTRNWRLIAPSLELRYTHSSGTPIGQNSMLGGLKAGKRFGRIDPYVDLLIGYGVIHISDVPGYTHDNSVVYDGGIGIDYSISSTLSVKVDVQQQFWKLGTTAHTLEPVNANIGIVYRIPFGWGRGREYHGH